MAGISMSMGGGFGGVSTANPATYGTPSSYDTVTAAAFGPGVTVPVDSMGQALNPASPVGMAMWVGVAAVAALVFIRYSLPN